MSDRVTIWLTNEEITKSCGSSLAKTLYDLPVDVLLSGDLGAGKTTFIQGFAQGLEIAQRVVSPTFALEQHYATASQHRSLVHIDLYRLTPAQARRQLEASDEHHGIRCIEWPTIHTGTFTERTIEIHLSEVMGKAGRKLEISFQDIALPSREEILAWREAYQLPKHVGDHCDSVADVAATLCDYLLQRGIIVRPLLVKRSAEVHDLLRFLDFRPGGHPSQSEPTHQEALVWNRVRETYADLKHEPACAAFLRQEGYDALAAVVEVHGLSLPSPERKTIEQQVLFYADKRVMQTTCVCIEERFADFKKRYGSGEPSAEAEHWFRGVRTVEKALFPDGCPL